MSSILNPGGLQSTNGSRRDAGRTLPGEPFSFPPPQPGTGVRRSRQWFQRRIPLPLSAWPLALLVAAFLLPGLIGHDLWKTEDAVGFGIVYEMLDGGGVLAPQLAGEPWFDDGPLYFWFAAGTARVLSFALPLQDGARVASALFVLITLWCVRLAARELYGKTQGDLSMLALMGCIGLMWHAHETAAESAMLAGLAAAYYGLAISHKKAGKAALFFGVGCGVAFLAKGVAAMAQPLAAALLVLPLSSELRGRSFALTVGLGLLVLAPFLVVWPALLAMQAPDYFKGWLAAQAAGINSPPRLDQFAEYVKLLAWAAWPAWPLTFWAMWTYRRYLPDPGYAVPFVATLVSFVLLLMGGAPREMNALAMLVPLAIPAGAAAVGLPRGAANALAWFAIMTFSLAAAFMWTMWLAGMTGVPEQLARTVTRLEPGFQPQLQPAALAVAIALTAGWLILVMRAERSTLRSLTHWAAGMTLAWGLAVTIWLAWIDYGKSYRTVAVAVLGQLPKGVECVESRGLGETQRAAFHYHANLRTRRSELYGSTGCPYLLVQAESRDRLGEPGPVWQRVWEGQRPRDRERFRLYRRVEP